MKTISIEQAARDELAESFEQDQIRLKQNLEQKE